MIEQQMTPDAKPEPYDSYMDTMNHILRVRELLYIIQGQLEARGFEHDQSKLKTPEKEAFDEMTPKLKGLTYGSDEYKSALKQLGVALEHHYAHNSHHPEYFKLWKCPLCKLVFDQPETKEAVVYGGKPRFCPNCCPVGSMFEATLEPHISVNGMTLLDVVEMFCDWKAATERHANGSFEKSIQQNRGRFHISDQLATIMDNTRKELGW